jgi:hypothetical protein
VSKTVRSRARRLRDVEHPLSVWVLIGLLCLLGVRGVLGGVQFLLVPSGELVGLSTADLNGSLFPNYRVPGLVLLTVLGVAPLVVARGLFRSERWAWFGALGVAAALAVWVLVEGVVVGFGRRLQYPNLLQAVLVVVVAVAPSVRSQYLTGSTPGNDPD